MIEMNTKQIVPTLFLYIFIKSKLCKSASVFPLSSSPQGVCPMLSNFYLSNMSEFISNLDFATFFLCLITIIKKKHPG